MKDSFAQNIEWLEICCKGVNKYTTLERLSQMLDIKIEDVINYVNRRLQEEIEEENT